MFFVRKRGFFFVTGEYAAIAVSIFSMCVFRIAFSYVLAVGLGMGAVGVWIAMILDWLARVAFLLPRFLSGKWKSFYHGAL